MVEALASCIRALRLGSASLLSMHLLARWEVWRLRLVHLHSPVVRAEHN
jgi:hypothetical protein